MRIRQPRKEVTELAMQNSKPFTRFSLRAGLFLHLSWKQHVKLGGQGRALAAKPTPAADVRIDQATRIFVMLKVKCRAMAYLMVAKGSLDVFKHFIDAPLLGFMVPAWPCISLRQMAAAVAPQKIYLAKACRSVRTRIHTWRC